MTQADHWAALPPTSLRPFFGFYGGKWRDTLKHYPAPRHKVIVEPFAGSAGFSVRYADREVVLCEKDPVIAGVWEYLIKVKASEIRAIGDVPPDGCVDDLHLSEEASALVGMWMNRGAARPRKRPSKWMREKIRPGSFWGDRVRNTIATQVGSIRHWRVYRCSYEDCPIVGPATWFVDPPYQMAGKHYAFGSDGISFPALAEWCRSRKGQVLVCENEGADWLPFRHLAHVKTTRRGRTSTEVFWTNAWDAVLDRGGPMRWITVTGTLHEAFDAGEDHFGDEVTAVPLTEWLNRGNTIEDAEEMDR